MPTHDELDRFVQDLARLSSRQKAFFGVIQDYILKPIRHHRVVKPLGHRAVWARVDFAPDIGVTGASESEAIRELYAALEEWLLLRLARSEPVPIVDDIDLNTVDGAAPGGLARTTRTGYFLRPSVVLVSGLARWRA